VIYQALDEHRSRQQRLESVKKELQELVEHIDMAGR
jgi:hypothetical protein